MEYEEDSAITAALSTRRIPHGKNSRSRRRGGHSNTSSSPSTATPTATATGSQAEQFKVKRSFGSYELSIPKARFHGAASNGAKGLFEIHGLTDDGDGVLASFELAAESVEVVRGMAVLAGSRRSLKRVVDRLETEDSSSDEVDSEEDVDAEGVEDGEERRHRTFEKNSFRQPKFWMQWRCLVSVDLIDQDQDQDQDEREAEAEGKNSGYLVFASNDCRTFQGTMSCARLGWDNVAVTGHKITAKTKRCPFAWTDFE